MRNNLILRPLAAALLACGLTPTAQAAATFDPASGELALPSVMLDWAQEFYAITLKRAATGTPLSLGDEFTIQTMTPNAMPEERNANFLSRTNTAYVPDVVVNTAEGEKIYRLLLQFRAQTGTLRVAGIEDASWYSFLTGEPTLSGHMENLQDQIKQAEMPVVCSNQSLQGTYGYSTSGSRKIDGEWYSYIEVGVNYFDGAGTLLNVYTNSLNNATYNEEGTYSVAPNCAAEMNYAGGDKFYLFTPPMGDKFYYIQATTPESPGVQSGWMTRQSKGLDGSCSAATLKGTYAYGSKGVKGRKLHTESGLESYDGAGNVTNIYTDTETGQILHSTGRYTIDPYCDALVTYEGGYQYTMHVAPNGDSLAFVQTAGLQAGEMLGGWEERVSMLSYVLAPGAAAATRDARATVRSSGTNSGGFSTISLSTISLETQQPTFDANGNMVMPVDNTEPNPDPDRLRATTELECKMFGGAWMEYYDGSGGACMPLP